jgi:hypothetical protein
VAGIGRRGGRSTSPNAPATATMAAALPSPGDSCPGRSALLSLGDSCPGRSALLGLSELGFRYPPGAAAAVRGWDCLSRDLPPRSALAGPAMSPQAVCVCGATRTGAFKGTDRALEATPRRPEAAGCGCCEASPEELWKVVATDGGRILVLPTGAPRREGSTGRGDAERRTSSTTSLDGPTAADLEFRSPAQLPASRRSAVPGLLGPAAFGVSTQSASWSSGLLSGPSSPRAQSRSGDRRPSASAAELGGSDSSLARATLTSTLAACAAMWTASPGAPWPGNI